MSEKGIWEQLTSRVKRLFSVGRTEIRQGTWGGSPSAMPPVSGRANWSQDSLDFRTPSQQEASYLWDQRRRCQNIAQNVPLIRRFIQLSKSHVVGQEPVRLEFPALSDRARKAVSESWHNWQSRSLTPRGQNLTQILQTILYHRIVDGDCAVRLLRPRSGGAGDESRQTSFQILGGDNFDDRIQHLAASADGVSVHLGVEIDAVGRAVAYHLFEDPLHRDRFGRRRQGSRRFTPSQAWHCVELDEHSGSVRGRPWLSTVAYDSDQLAESQHAYITRMRRQAQAWLALKQDLGEGAAPFDESVQAAGGIAGPGPGSGAGNEAFASSDYFDSKIGQQLVLPPGYEPVQIQTGAPAPHEIQIFDILIRSISSGLGVSHILLASRYDQVNFSSAQMAALEDAELWRRWQAWLERVFLRRAWWIFIREHFQIDSANIRVADAALLVGPQAQYPRFVFRAQQTLEAHRMVPALAQAVEKGIMTRAEAREKLGLSGKIADFADNVLEEREIFESRGLDFSAMMPQTPGQDDDDDDDEASSSGSEASPPNGGDAS